MTITHTPIQGNISIEFKNEYIDIRDIDDKIALYWKTEQAKRQKEKKTLLTDDTIIMYREIEAKTHPNGNITIPAMKAHYSLYTYLTNNPMTDDFYKARSIAPVTIFSTMDNYFVLGTMSKDTSLGGKILAPGGAVDCRDVRQNHVEIKDNIRREILEEIGLDIQDQSLLKTITPISIYLSKERAVLILSHHGILNIDRQEMNERFIAHNKRLVELKERPELTDLVFIPNDREELRNIYKNNRVLDYVPGTIELINSLNRQ